MFTDLLIDIACYFASLIQVLFHLPNITQKILSFNSSEFDAHFKNIQLSKDLEKVEKNKLLASREVVKNLQLMFSKMLLSNVKYQDPTKVLEAIIDDFGNPISIYEQ